MRDELPSYRNNKECGILNLNTSAEPDSHWVAYAKYEDYIEYFDSYENLKPPRELVKYLGTDIYYNYDNTQKNHPYNCGHICIKFLRKFWLKLEVHK